jgi:flavodoxin
MNIAIVYYSMSGNTEYVAKYIADKTNADLIKIEPRKEYPSKGLKKFLWGGKSAVMGETPLLENYEFDGNKYDYIIIGTPVWASSFTPPIRSFIKDNKERLNGKKIGVFVCNMGGGADKAIEKLKQYLEIDRFEVELKLIDPKDKKSEEKDKAIEEFCKKIMNN